MNAMVTIQITLFIMTMDYPIRALKAAQNYGFANMLLTRRRLRIKI